MDTTYFIIGLLVCLALFFDFTNGFHDAANSIATIVSTRVLSPKQAVIWAAFFNFIAFLLFGTLVAKTVGNGLVDINYVTVSVIFAGLVGTILWNITTWYLGLPTSSSHALIGGYAGAVIARAGFGALILSGWVKTILFIFLAPAIGLVLGILFVTAVSWLFYHQPRARVNRWSRVLQIFSAAFYSIGHGGNDAQKTMGIIASLLFTTGQIQTFSIPLWVVLVCQSALALGTLFGGWRIVKTMGSKITRLRPIDGFCAESASAISIFLATHLGAPVSTTHVITGAISGVGAAKRMSAVRWQITLQIVWAWILTIPLSGLVAYLVYKVTHLIR